VCATNCFGFKFQTAKHERFQSPRPACGERSNCAAIRVRGTLHELSLRIEPLPAFAGTTRECARVCATNCFGFKFQTAKHERFQSPCPACGERSNCQRVGAKRRPMIGSAIRVRGTLHELSLRIEPLTPTLSPQAGRGRRNSDTASRSRRAFSRESCCKHPAL
jgi:hypothetical protein